MDKDTYRKEYRGWGPALRAISVFCLCLSLSLVMGFKVPRPDEIRSDIRQELQKIKEMTPREKARLAWLKSVKKAEALMENALSQGAKEYAEKDFIKAKGLLSLSRQYAKRREYRKAEYLARKAQDAFSEVAKNSVERRKTELSKRKTVLQGLEKEVDGLKASLKVGEKADVSGNGTTEALISRLDARLLILKSAILAEDLHAFDKEAKALRKDIKVLKDKFRPQ